MAIQGYEVTFGYTRLFLKSQPQSPFKKKKSKLNYKFKSNTRTPIASCPGFQEPFPLSPQFTALNFMETIPELERSRSSKGESCIPMVGTPGISALEKLSRKAEFEASQCDTVRQTHL